ncbi:MAG: outer membrane beta-barrel protein, partial [Rhizomicrobium sp.]
MKIRMMALAGVAALALTGPALASDATGWYLGVTGGYDHMGQVEIRQSNPTFDFNVKTQDSGLWTGTFGYKFDRHIRFEGEVGYNRHNLDTTVLPSGTYSGHTSTLSAMANLFYDYPLSDRWTFSFGAGAGIGSNDTLFAAPGPIDGLDGTRQGFMW